MKYTGEKPKMKEQIDVINVYVTMITVLTRQTINDILIKRTTKYRFFFKISSQNFKIILSTKMRNLIMHSAVSSHMSKIGLV